MKRFEFPLERVLHFRKQQEQLAHVRQMEALAELRKAEALEQQWRMEIEKTATAMTERDSVGFTVAARLAGLAKLEQLRRGLQAAEALTRKAAAQFAEASDQRKRLAIAVEGLKKLRERYWERHRAAVARAEQLELDEIGIRRWQPPTDGREEQGESS